MKKVIYIDGGAGRAIAALPALEKLVRNSEERLKTSIAISLTRNLISY